MQTRRDFLKIAGVASAAAAGGIVAGYTIRGAVDRPAAPGVGGELAIYNWSDYIFAPLLDEFRRETGVTRIQYDTFLSEDDVWAALERAPSGYDLALLVDSNVSLARQSGYILPLDHRNLPNLGLLDPSFDGLAYDPEHAYSAPYVWGTTGIGVNTAVVSRPVTSWAAMFDPVFLQENYRKVTMLDDMRETMGAALLALGADVNSADSADIQGARDALIAQKAYLAEYASTDLYQPALVAGDWAASHAWNGDIVQIRPENAAIEYVVPSEGAIMWVDNFVIPAGAKNQAAAEAFINFMLDPAHATLNTSYIGYPNANRLSTEWLPDDIKLDPAIYPDPVTMSKLSILNSLDAATMDLWAAAWDEVLRA